MNLRRLSPGGLLLAMLAALVAPDARAELKQGPVDLQLFRPAMDTKGYITLNGSQILAPKDFSFGLVATWARNPLVLEANGSKFRVDNLLTPSLQAAVGLFASGQFGFELGFVMPVNILSGKGDPEDPGSPTTTNDDQNFKFAAQGPGDLMIHPKLRLSNASRNKLGLAVIPTIIVPTGDKQHFFGEGAVILQPAAVVDAEFGRTGRFKMALNVGARLRTTPAQFIDDAASFDHNVMMMPANTGRGIKVGNELLAGLGAAFGVVPERFEIVGEVISFLPIGSSQLPSGSLGPNAEALAGIKLYLARNSFFVIGGGVALLHSYGSAQGGRAFMGIIFEPSIGDRDRDGYKDDVDQCPDDPEDFDDFEDEDGCPDPDNDKEGILDEDDKCPNVPETKNGFEDEDGCPDNAGNDRDGDGIPDDVDQCPDDPEDKDGFEDEDGCPDPDNDKDGILDVDDLCPNDPEDKDGFEDKDGCPDPDTDKDRILDVNDKCPNEPETYNGVDDDDGCPDKGRVIVRRGKLEILDKIYFETDRDEIKAISFPLLDAIAATLNGNPQLLQIEIQGHADERGNDDHNLDLTDRRAHSVQRALEERNVEPGRLRAKGYGETKPICNQHTEICWSQNRRVEFIIMRRADEAQLQGSE